MEAGDIGYFKHDYNSAEIHHGIVVSVNSHVGDFDMMSVASYEVMCSDGKLREFLATDHYFSHAEQDPEAIWRAWGDQ